MLLVAPDIEYLTEEDQPGCSPVYRGKKAVSNQWNRIKVKFDSTRHLNLRLILENGAKARKTRTLELRAPRPGSGGGGPAPPAGLNVGGGVIIGTPPPEAPKGPERDCSAIRWEDQPLSRVGLVCVES